MAGRIRQEDVDAVLARTDIVQVISQYLQLKKSGRDSLTGLFSRHRFEDELNQLLARARRYGDTAVTFLYAP